MVILLICSPPALLYKNEMLIWHVSGKMILQDRDGTQYPPACMNASQKLPDIWPKMIPCEGSQITGTGGLFLTLQVHLFTMK